MTSLRQFLQFYLGSPLQQSGKGRAAVVLAAPVANVAVNIALSVAVVVAILAPSAWATLQFYSSPFFYTQAEGTDSGVHLFSSSSGTPVVAISGCEATLNGGHTVSNLFQMLPTYNQAFPVNVVSVSPKKDGTYLLNLYMHRDYPKVAIGWRLTPPPPPRGGTTGFTSVSLTISGSVYKTLFEHAAASIKPTVQTPTLAFIFTEGVVSKKDIIFDRQGYPCEAERNTTTGGRVWHLPAAAETSTGTAMVATAEASTADGATAIQGRAGAPVYETIAPEYETVQASKTGYGSEVLYESMQDLTLESQLVISDETLEQPLINPEFIEFLSYTLISAGKPSASWAGFTIDQLFKHRDDLRLREVNSFAGESERQALRQLTQLTRDNDRASDAVHQLLPHTNRYALTLTQWADYATHLESHPLAAWEYLNEVHIKDAFKASVNIIDYIEKKQFTSLFARFSPYWNKQLEQDRMVRFRQRQQALTACIEAAAGHVPQSCIYEGKLTPTMTVMKGLTAQAWSHLPYYVLLSFISNYFSTRDKDPQQSSSIAATNQKGPYIDIRVLVSTLISELHRMGAPTLPEWLQSYIIFHMSGRRDYRIAIPEQKCWQLNDQACSQAIDYSEKFCNTLAALQNVIQHSPHSPMTIGDMQSLAHNLTPMQNALMRCTPSSGHQPELPYCNWTASQLIAHWRRCAGRGGQYQPSSSPYHAPQHMLKTPVAREGMEIPDSRAQVVNTMQQMAGFYLNYLPLLLVQTQPITKPRS